MNMGLHRLHLYVVKCQVSAFIGAYVAGGGTFMQDQYLQYSQHLSCGPYDMLC